jgi:two-component system, LytTR family, sensor kinase
LVPSFAVQTLVENAIRHGIAKTPDAGRLRVQVERVGDMLAISVIDDGAGIDPDRITPGHGIENTRERLRALYGDNASLDVTKRPEGGTIAILRVPYRG